MDARTSGRLAFVVVALLAAFAVSTQTTAAAVVVSSSGSLGKYVLTDTSSAEGARCTYETASYDLDTISIRGAKVWARNKTTGQDGQWVSWQYIIQHTKTATDGGWVTYHKSSVIEKYAYDDQPAVFGRHSWTAPESQNFAWRVEIVITWYHFSETEPKPVEGTVKLRDQHYELVWNGNSYNDQPLCAGHF